MTDPQACIAELELQIQQSKSRVAALEEALKITTSALQVIQKCLRADTGAVGEYWCAREWLRNQGRYEDNLEELAVPLEVCDVALLEAEARTPQEKS